MPKAIGAGWMSAVIAGARRWIRGIVFGRPLATSVQLEHRLPILLALPVFASDALSSVAYATQEILIAFEHENAFKLALMYILPISIAIAVLILIVGFSYRQAIHLYPSGGGSYSVSRDNLGVLPGLVAAGALVIDYILTVAVSISSGVENLAAAVPAIQGSIHIFGIPIGIRVMLAVLLVLLITLINLRGTKESGWVFALPAYSFVAMLGTVLVFSAIRFITGNYITFDTHHAATTIPPASDFTGIALMWLILRAFSSGCSALTGVEAVSNGVSAFEPPEAKNAAKTLSILIGTLAILFIGVGYAAMKYQALPSESETTISQLAQGAFSGMLVTFTVFKHTYAINILYALTIIATLSVLMIAANTSFAGFPRLLAIVAQDGYAPKTFVSLGDRLVYNRGIIALAIVAVILIIVFDAHTSALIPLYAVGVFICFTLSQLGMVKKVRDLKEAGWQRMMAVNMIGAIVTGFVAIIQAATKFWDGAFVVVILLPILVLISYAIRRHYDWFDAKMTLHPYDYNPLKDPTEPLTVLVLVSSDVHRGILEGLEAGRAIADGRPDNILRAIHIELDPEKTPRLKAKWEQFVEPYMGETIQLDIIPSPFRWLVEPLMDYLDEAELERPNDRVIVVLPEFETGSTITHFLHNFTARRLRAALLNRPHITVVSSRFFMRPIAWRRGRGGLVY